VQSGEPSDDGVTANDIGISAPDHSAVAAARPPEPLGRRILRPQTIVSFGLAVAIILFFFSRLDVDPNEVLRNVRSTDLRLYAAAWLLYYGSFGLRAARWRWMMADAGVRNDQGFTVPPLRRFAEIIMLSWFVNCVVPAKVGDAYRSYLAKRATGSTFSTSLGTILAERLTDLTVLFATMTTAGIIAFHGRLPAEATRTLILGIGLLVIGFAGLTGLWFARHAVERRLPVRLRKQFGHLHDAIFACLRKPWRPVAMSILIWLGDGLRFYCVGTALGADLSYSTAAFVSLMSALLTTLPVTPAGLGVVEVAMVTMLKLVDVNASLAGSIALMDRLLSYWSLVAVGLVLYLRRLRHDVREADMTS
jgi:uncharacterized membrane protein YbhN (UPF0104 family)